MGFAFCFCAVFLLIASGGLLLFYREAMIQRISDAINPQPQEKTTAEHAIRSRVFHRRHGRALRECPAQEPGGSLRCPAAPHRAGFRNESAIKIFYGSKVLVPLSCAPWPWSPAWET